MENDAVQKRARANMLRATRNAGESATLRQMRLQKNAGLQPKYREITKRTSNLQKEDELRHAGRARKEQMRANLSPRAQELIRTYDRSRGLSGIIISEW
jgi:hypothetical protein